MWRKVMIDDYVPVSENGSILLPLSSMPGELWPALLAKAICRVLTPSYEVRIDTPEFGEANIMHLLTGWVPEIVTLDADRYACIIHHTQLEFF